MEAPGGAPVAVLAHGAGSTADFLRRAFGPALERSGWRLAALEDRTGDVGAVEGAIDVAVRETGAALVGGVSLGAHAAARWAADSGAAGCRGLLLVLPAWTGPAAEVASWSAATARSVERGGVDGALRDLPGESWVAAELARAWPRYGSGLVAALDAAAGSAGPSAQELASIIVPTGVVGLAGDPFHPVEVARDWAAAVPRSGLVELAAGEPAEDVSVLGFAGLRALDVARGQASKR